jgi:hypothetical protein
LIDNKECGTIPFGFRKVPTPPKGAALVPVPEEQDAIKRMVDMRRSGASLRAIAAAMAADGFKLSHMGVGKIIHPIAFYTNASGIFQSLPPMSGSVIGVRFFADPANVQGAGTVTDTPGNLIANLSGTDTGFFRLNQGILLSESAPISMTETASIFLAPNTQLLKTVHLGNYAARLRWPWPRVWSVEAQAIDGLTITTR